MQPTPQTDARILAMADDNRAARPADRGRADKPHRHGRLLWLSVAACFLLLNAVGLWVIHRAVSEREAPALLTIDEFAPRVMDEPASPITVRFNVDLVSADQVGQPVDGEPISFSPAVAGRFRWDTRRQITFLPAGPLQKARVYTAVLNRELGARVNLALDGSGEFQFSTRPLTLTDAAQVGFDDGRHVVIELTFDDVVVPDELARHLRLTDGRNVVEYDLVTAVKSKSMRIRTEALASEELYVELKPGLVGASGPLGIERPLRRQVPLAFLLQLRDTSAYTPFDGKPWVRASFSCPVNAAEAGQFIETEPAVKFQVVPLGWDNGIKLVGDFEPGQRYRVTFKAGLPALEQRTDRRVVAADQTRSVWLPDREAGLSLKHERGGYLSPEGNLLVPYTACNVKKVELTVCRVFDNNLVHVVNDDRGTRSLSSLAKQLVKRTLAIDSAKNARFEGLIDLRELLGREARGLLLVTLRDTEEYWVNADCLIAVTDLGIAAKTSGGDLLVWVNSIRKAAPVAGATVCLYSEANQKLFEGRSDADGLVQLQRADFGDQTPALLTAEAAGDVSYLQLDRGRVGTEGFDTLGRPYLRKGYEAFCFTDRDIYRPGETVHCRAIVRGVELTAPADFPVAFEVRRPDDRKLATLTATLADGAAEVDIPLPTDGMTGQYRVRVKLPGADDSLGGTHFRCEEFLPNRLRVSLTGGDGPLKCDMDAEFHVASEYLFGAPAAGLAATSHVRFIDRTFRHPAWTGYSFRDDTRTFVAGNQTRLTDEQLDDAGKTDLIVPIPKVTCPSAMEMVVTATVKEISGRGVSATVSRSVDPTPYYVGIRQEFEGYAGVGEPAKFLLAAVLPDGKPAADIEALETVLGTVTWNTVLKHGDDGRYRYESTEIFTPVQTTRVPLAGGKGELLFTPPACGSYRLRVAAVPPSQKPADVAPKPADCVGGVSAATQPSSQPASSLDTPPERSPGALEEDAPPGPLPPAPPAWGRMGEVNPGDAPRPVMAARTAEPAASCSFYVSSPQWNYTPWSMARPERIEIATDKPQYRPGEQAKLIVKSPFAGRLLLTVETDRVLSVRTLDMDKNTAELPLVVRDEYRPNVYVSAVVIRPVEPNAPEWVAHRAYGVQRVRVDCGDRRLKVALDAPEAVRPRTKVTVPLTVTNSRGEPASAQVTVMAVDEGVLSLTRFATPDPHKFFYADRGLGVEASDLYSRLMPETPRQVGQDRSAGGDGGDADQFDPGRLNPIAAQRVKVVALWAGTVQAGEDGKASVDLDVPAFTGELRLMAVAAGRDAFGAADKPLKVRSPLLVQSSFPRFGAPGDEFVVPMTIFNHTGAAGTVKLSLAADGPVGFVADEPPAPQKPADCVGGVPSDTPTPTQPATRPEEQPASQPASRPATSSDTPQGRSPWAFEGEIAAGAQRTVFARVRAAMEVGVAEFTLHATLGDESFEESVELPVRPAAPRTLLAGTAVADAPAVGPGEVKTLQIPGGWVPGTARCRLVVSGLPDLELAGGLEWLLHYPYGCVEQTTSSAMPLLYLTDLAAVVDPERVGPVEVEHYVQAGIHRLLSMQTVSGGLSYWPGYRDVYDYGTLYGGEFLIEAAGRGYDVPKDCIKALLDYIDDLLNDAPVRSDNEAEQQAAIRNNLELKAHALVLLARGGRSRLAWMSRLTERIEQMSAVGRYRLAEAYAAAGKRDVALRIVGTVLPPGDPTRQTGGLLSSPTKEAAVCLIALLRIDAKDSRIPQLVQRLRATRVNGYWGTTQENAYGLMALGMYARVLAKNRAPFVAKVMLPGETEPRVATDEKPLTFTGDLSGKAVTLRVEGKGTAYCYWSVQGVPIDGKVAETDGGIRIRRRFLDRDGAALDPAKLKQGELVVVELTVDSPRSDLDNLVLVDLLPAGLEIENPVLETSDRFDAGGANSLYVQRTDMRDDRMILFAGVWGGGARVYRYATRAVTCGRFVLPAAQVECMYDPAVASLNGRGEIVVSK